MERSTEPFKRIKAFLFKGEFENVIDAKLRFEVNRFEKRCERLIHGGDLSPCRLYTFAGRPPKSD